MAECNNRHSSLIPLLRCGICGLHLRSPQVLPCSHRFCSACIRTVPGRLCPECRVPYFENELAADPYTEGVLDRVAAMVDQLRNANRLHEPGSAELLPRVAPRQLTEEEQAAEEQAAALEERIQLLEKRLRAQHAIILANVHGPLAGSFAFAQPAPAAPELLCTPARSQQLFCQLHCHLVPRGLRRRSPLEEEVAVLFGHRRCVQTARLGQHGDDLIGRFLVQRRAADCI